MSAECKLTPEITEIICEHIEKGNSFETAAQAVGICRDTIYDWMKRGEKSEPNFLQFLQSIKKARAKAEMRYVAVIDKAAASEKNWTAAAWWLERTNSKQWGNKQETKIEHSGKITFEQLRELLKSDEPTGSNKTVNADPVPIPAKTDTKLTETDNNK
jgi:predicted DNA-binding protein YlxM (UPF0122 family)